MSECRVEQFSVFAMGVTWRNVVLSDMINHKTYHEKLRYQGRKKHGLH